MPRAYSPPRARLSASDCEGRAFGALPQRPYDALVGVLDASWTHGAQPQSAALVAALLKALGQQEHRGHGGHTQDQIGEIERQGRL